MNNDRFDDGESVSPHNLVHDVMDGEEVAKAEEDLLKAKRSLAEEAGGGHGEQVIAHLQEELKEA